MNKIHSAFAIALLLGASVYAQRPHNPFVERVTTSERSRQLKVALNANLWVMYDLPQCQLYTAWAGGANGGSLVEPFESATGVPFFHRPHYKSWFVPAGTSYFKEAVGEYFASWTKPEWIDTYYSKVVVDKDFAHNNLKWKQQPRNYHAWTVTNSGTNVNAETRFRAYRVKGNTMELDFGLILPDKREIAVTEVPDYAAAGGKTSLVRKFNFTGIPAGYSVALKLPGSGWSGTGVNGGTFTVAADGDVTLTGAW
jgi:hypothetical protein